MASAVIVSRTLLTIAASFNEKVLLQNGLLISPLGGNDTAKGMREIISLINNDKDFQTYAIAHTSQVPPRKEIKYTQHPVSPHCKTLLGLTC